MTKKIVNRICTVKEGVPNDKSDEEYLDYLWEAIGRLFPSIDGVSTYKSEELERITYGPESTDVTKKNDCVCQEGLPTDKFATLDLAIPRYTLRVGENLHIKAVKAPPLPCPHPEWEAAVFDTECEAVWETPRPCPHPEWEGVWLKSDEFPYRVEWENGIFMAREINPEDPYYPDNNIEVGNWDNEYDWDDEGPGKYWAQLEPAPTQSIAGKKLDRPKKHGEITTPWDPWEM